MTLTRGMVFFDLGSTLIDESGAHRRCVMVGDRIDNDIVPAKRLGMRTVRFLQGYHRLASPRDVSERADLEVERLEEIPPWLV